MPESLQRDHTRKLLPAEQPTVECVELRRNRAGTHFKRDLWALPSRPCSIAAPTPVDLSSEADLAWTFAPLVRVVISWTSLGLRLRIGKKQIWLGGSGTEETKSAE